MDDQGGPRQIGTPASADTSIDRVRTISSSHSPGFRTNPYCQKAWSVAYCKIVPESQRTPGMITHDSRCGSAFLARILAEMEDVIIVTDLDHRILFWNSGAEQFYGVQTELAMDSSLSQWCPGLWSELERRQLSVVDLANSDWEAELELFRAHFHMAWIAVKVSLLYDEFGVAEGILYLQRDVTDRRRLETELWLCHERLRVSVEGSEEAIDKSTGHDVVLWAEDNDDDAALMARAWRKAGVDDRLVRVSDGDAVIRYLIGDGIWGDREQFPLPRLLVLDLNMPGRSGLKVIEWLRQEMRWNDLPVVILTSSTAPGDIRRAAQFSVKGYLVKPLDANEWVMKVKTLTSQCR